MKKYYQDHAEALFNLGYSPIPIKPKSKIPFFGKGESWQIPIDLKLLKIWAANGKGSGSVAIKDIGAIDCDIRDKDMSNFMIKNIREIIGDDIAIRVGHAPKFLIPIAPSSAVNHKLKWTWYDLKGVKQEIEILSPGDQYFVAYGEHPSGTEYRWLGGPDLLKRDAIDLPIIDEMDLAQIEDIFNTEAERLGWTQENPNKKETINNSPQHIIDDDFKVPGGRNAPGGIAELRVWLRHLDKHCCDDRDEWIKIGAALHHETAGSNEGWVLFDSWSQDSEKYTGRIDTLKRWESYQNNRGVNGSKCATAGTIVQALKDSGGETWDRAHLEGQEARINTVVECSVDQDDSCDTDGVSVVDNVVQNLNKKHAIVSVVGKAKIMNFHDTGDINDDIDFSSVMDLHNLYANKMAFVGEGKKKKKVAISKIWMTHLDRRQYSGIIFKPGASLSEVGSNYNLWQGLAIKPKQGDWSLYRDHVINIIADGDKEAGEWILAWIARIIQDPGGERPGTALVLRGNQGTGKGVFVNVLGVVFGRHFLQVSNGGQLTGRFNSHLKDKVVVFVDEAIWAGDKRAEGVIKSIITEPYIPIEQKGIDIIRVENHINLIIASNNEWVVPAGMEERRFNTRQIPNHKQQNHRYFKAIIDQMYHNGGIEAMVYDMLKMDISGINLKTFKKTAALLDQSMCSMDVFHKYWLERLIDGELLSGNQSSVYSDFRSVWGSVSTNALYDDYLSFSEKMKERYPKSNTQFGIALHTIYGESLVKKRQSMDKSTGKQGYEYVFSNIEICRALFEKRFNGLKLWDEEGNFISGVQPEKKPKDTETNYDDEVPF